MIKINNLTKDYGDGKGIFEINLNIKKGEVLGLVGSNGAGKTTLIRSIMGFLKPDKGTIKIKGYDSYFHSDITKKMIGYVPGEIAFPDLKTGEEFIDSQAELLGLENKEYTSELIRKLQLDTSANLKRMSKGMKQKTATVVALMNDADILILDEPTTGLDPLMRDVFLNIIEDEKKKGKTILITSHLYEELERICDRVALIDKGKIISSVNMEKINNRHLVDLKIEFNKQKDYKDFLQLKFNIIRIQEQYNQATIRIEKNKLKDLFVKLMRFDLKFISEVKYSLEQHFIELVRKENNHD